jgi:MFS family permease
VDGGAIGAGSDSVRPGDSAFRAETDHIQAGGGRKRHRMFSSLRMRNFRLFAAGQVVSNTGTWMQRVAQDWLVLELTHGSGTAVGIATGLQFLPLLLFSLWGGMIADRYPKRRVLMVTQAAMGALAVLLGVLAVTGVVQPWHIYLLAFGLGLATMVDNPTRQSFAIEMVGRDDLQNAIALNSAVFNLARITGPALAGIVISLIGTPAAFFLNATSYLTVIISLHLMRPSELRPAERVARAKGQLREGLAYVRSRPDLLMTMVLVFFIATFGMNFQVTTALMSRVVFHTGAGRFGIASAVFAIGALIGALVAARRSRTGMRLMITAAFAFGLLEAATGLMPYYWAFLVLLVPTGMAVISFTTLANSSVQLSVPAEMRGRVMGIYMLVFLGGAPIGSPLTGWVAELFGTRIAILAGAVISVAATSAVAALVARRRGIPVRRYFRQVASARNAARA